MLAVLRFIGVVNAAVWFGAAIFFTLGVGPGFFSPEMLKILPRPYAGAAAQVIIERYFMLQHWCGAIALVHWLVEWLYTGRPLQKILLYLLLGLFVASLAGGFWMQPQMHRLHYVMYAGKFSAAEVQKAKRAFGLWHGASQVVNLIMMGGVLVYLWGVTHPIGAPRIPILNKFRG